MLRKLFSRTPFAAAEGSVFAIPEGERVYAIGDIHGCLDALERLLAEIAADDAARGPAITTIVILGDVIDRGPKSGHVVERLLRLHDDRPTTRFLKGNHEEVFLHALAGDEQALRLFCRIGGRETIISYGMTPTEYEMLDYTEVAARLETLVPRTHRAFLDAFEDMVTIGDYAFVHAGVRPNVALEEQKGSDLRWMRQPFLDFRGRHEKMIVHGHTISEEVERRVGRIGVDTGAYAGGPLSALGLEGAETWVLQAATEGVA